MMRYFEMTVLVSIAVASIHLAKMNLLVITIVCVGFLMNSTAETAQAYSNETVFYVATAGNDSWSGTLPKPNAQGTDGPFATLERARDVVRTLKSKSAVAKPVTVFVRGGTYRLERTFELTREDAGTEQAPVVYEAYGDERPVLSAASPLPGPWGKVPNDLPGLTEEACGNVWATKVPDDWPLFRTLFQGDEMLPRARSHGFRQLEQQPAESQVRIDQHHLYLPPEVLQEIASFSGAEMVLVPQYPWVMNILPMTEVNRRTGLVRTAVPATYALQPPTFGRFPHGTLWVENVLQVLDEPGEWVLDGETRTLYLWPKMGNLPGDDIVAPRLTEMVRVQGTVRYAAPQDRPVRGLVFRGLTFTHADRWPWQQDKAGWGLQHDWEMFDRPTAMVRFRAAEDCVVEHCRFVNAGSAGVRLDLHCQNIRISACEIANLGGVGVLLAGYGMGTKDVNCENEVSDCHIHHVGRLLWHSPAVFAWQSGHNRIEHNHIHHTPYTAIVVSGRTQMLRNGKGECSRTIRWEEVDRVLEEKPATWQNREPLMHGRENIVAYNDIHHCMEGTADGNAIYVSGTGAGNLVTNNFIHDITSPNINAAIRCDDDQHQTVIEKNIITRCCGEGFIFKGNNLIRNNIIYDLRDMTPEGIPCVHQRGYIVMPSGDVSGSIVQRNVFVSRIAGQALLKVYARFRTCKADYNLYFNTADPQWGQRHMDAQREFGVEQQSVSADPKFVAPHEDDFSLEPGSPARKLGFEVINISEVGPRGQVP